MSETKVGYKLTAKLYAAKKLTKRDEEIIRGHMAWVIRTIPRIRRGKYTGPKVKVAVIDRKKGIYIQEWPNMYFD
jgi:hypothetical protein